MAPSTQGSIPGTGGIAGQASSIMGQQAGPLSPFPQPNWLNYSSQGGVPGLVDPVAASRVTERDVVNHVQHCIAESKAARQPLESEWRLHQDLYLNRLGLDEMEKADWQANVFIPAIFNKIELAKSLIKGSLLESPSWFVLEEYPGWQNETSTTFLERLLRLQLERAGFVGEYMKALEEGFLLGSGCFRLFWDDWIERGPELIEVPLYQDPMQAAMAQYYNRPTTMPMVESVARPKNGMKIAHVPLWALYPDPYAAKFSECKYIVEECAIDDDDLQEGVLAGKYDFAGDIGPAMAFDMETEHRARETGLAFQPIQPKRKRHLLQLYHGNIYTRDGKLALENWRVIVANKRTIIACGPNPLFTGRWPYIWTTPIPVRGRVWGRSLVAAAASMQIELNNLVNLMIDATTLSTVPIATKDASKLDDPDSIDSLTPGTVYPGKEGGITPLKFGSVPNEAWPIVQMFDNRINESTISDLLAGNPTSKGRPTAYEIRSTMQTGQAQIHNVARSLEMGDLEPAVQLAYELDLQFLSDASDPEIQAILAEQGGPMNLADPLVRFRMLNAKFKVKARGISMMLSRDEQIDKRMQLAQLGQQMGIPMPNGPLQLFYGIARLMGVDPREIGEPETAEELAAMLMQMQAAQAAGAGAQGESGAARHVAPEPPQTPSGPPQPNSPQMLMNQVQNNGPPMPGM